MYVGQKVRAVVQVLHSDGGSVIGKSTDDHQLTVRGSAPGSLTKFVEVIGIADGEKSIRAEIWTNFGDTFGKIILLSLDLFPYCGLGPLNDVIRLYLGCYLNGFVDNSNLM